MKEREKIIYNDWEVIPSSTYCSKVADGTHDTPKPLEEGKKLVTSTHLKEGMIKTDEAYFISENDFISINRRSKVDKWDVLFSMIGTVGEIAIVKDEPDFAIKNIGLFKTKTESDGLWLYYYLTSNIGQAIIETYSTGSSQRFVSLGDLRKLPILNPRQEIKLRIIEVLKCFDEQIDNNNQRIAILEHMAEQIYKEWFVRMRFPGYEHAEFEKGVPKGWEVKRIKQLVTTQYGFTATSEVENSTGVKFLRITDVANGEITWDNVPFCTINENILDKYLLKEGDIVVARTGATVGFAKRLNKRHPLSVFASYLVRLVAKDKKLSYYLGFIVESTGYKDFIQSIAGGSAQPQANAQVLTEMQVLNPPSNLIVRFNSIIEPLIDQSEILRMQNIILKQTRDMLLPRLISGKLRVKDLPVQD